MKRRKAASPKFPRRKIPSYATDNIYLPLFKTVWLDFYFCRSQYTFISHHLLFIIILRKIHVFFNLKFFLILLSLLGFIRVLFSKTISGINRTNNFKKPNTRVRKCDRHTEERELVTQEWESVTNRQTEEREFVIKWFNNYKKMYRCFTRYMYFKICLMFFTERAHHLMCARGVVIT